MAKYCNLLYGYANGSTTFKQDYIDNDFLHTNSSRIAYLKSYVTFPQPGSSYTVGDKTFTNIAISKKFCGSGNLTLNQFPCGILVDNNAFSEFDKIYLYKNTEIIYTFDLTTDYYYPSGNYRIYPIKDITVLNTAFQCDDVILLCAYQEWSASSGDDDDFVCDGIDLSENHIQPNNLVFDFIYSGNDLLGNNHSDTITVSFTDEDMLNGYKDVTLTSAIVDFNDVAIKQKDNQVLGDGYITLRGKYLEAFDLVDEVIDTFELASTGVGLLACLADLGLFVSDVVNDTWYENFNTFHLEPCSRYGSIETFEIEDTSAVNMVITFAETVLDVSEAILDPFGFAIDQIHFDKFLFPIVRFTINSGFDEMVSDESWCCPAIDSSPITQTRPPITITGEGGKPTEPTEPTEPTPPSSVVVEFDECICDNLETLKLTLEEKLEMINDTLEGIKSAIENLDLSAISDKLECDNSSIACILKNGRDVDYSALISGIITAIQPVSGGINNLITAILSGLTCNGKSLACILKDKEIDLDGLSCDGETLACILKSALNREAGNTSKSITETIHDSLNRDNRNVVDAIDDIQNGDIYIEDTMAADRITTKPITNTYAQVDNVRDGI